MNPDNKRGGFLAITIGFVWALFQLSLPQFVILDNVAVRSIHLAFALSLVFATTPMFKHKKNIPLIHNSKHLALLDMLLLLLSVGVIAFLLVNRESIASRAGASDTSDVIIGGILVLLVMEAARRSIGSPMVILVIVLSAYAFLGPYLPPAIAFRGVRLGRYMQQIVHSTEGIFGIPLHVSASTVYLFVLFGALLDKFGAGMFFNDLAISLLGGFLGGPAKASVISSGLTGIASGSSIANVVTTGTFPYLL